MLLGRRSEGYRDSAQARFLYIPFATLEEISNAAAIALASFKRTETTPATESCGLEPHGIRLEAGLLKQGSPQRAVCNAPFPLRTGGLGESLLAFLEDGLGRPIHFVLIVLAARPTDLQRFQSEKGMSCQVFEIGKQRAQGLYGPAFQQMEELSTLTDFGNFTTQPAQELGRRICS
ncbi:hypothetical protein [Pseudomonas hormoni]